MHIDAAELTDLYILRTEDEMKDNSSFLEYVRPEIEKSLYDYFSSPRKKILFGKGRQATIINDVCRMCTGGGIAALVSTQNEPAREEMLRSIKSYSMEDFPESEKKETDVLIAVNEKWNEQIENDLKNSGFVHIYKAEDWKAANSVFRRSYFEYMMLRQGVDTAEEILCRDSFRIYNWKQMSREYEESFLVEAVDLLYPFLFGDLRACVEGPYEYGKAVFRRGTVIDAGANIGMFSCCAAARGCRVYAFEPTASAREYLRKNAGLYREGMIEIESCALSDHCGKEFFSVNDAGEGTKNRLSRQPEAGSHLEEAAVITIDAYAEQKIGKVDFIKADIEGAERKMLMGAQKTLKESAPVLSLCTYHLPDDREVLTELILNANPKYKIQYGWQKLYAYVPEE